MKSAILSGYFWISTNRGTFQYEKVNVLRLYRRQTSWNRTLGLGGLCDMTCSSRLIYYGSATVPVGSGSRWLYKDSLVLVLHASIPPLPQKLQHVP
jgi:hypothetical protein